MDNNTTPQYPDAPISQATVKVMRSYDYCHFEVALSSDSCVTLDEVNELRKQAAILVDEAVRQYKIAKEKEKKRDSKDWELRSALADVDNAKKVPENERTIHQAALLRAYEDKSFWKQFEEDDWYYGEDAERDHHFSMLRKFQDTRVSAG